MDSIPVIRTAAIFILLPSAHFDIVDTLVSYAKSHVTAGIFHALPQKVGPPPPIPANAKATQVFADQPNRISFNSLSFTSLKRCQYGFLMNYSSIHYS